MLSDEAASVLENNKIKNVSSFIDFLIIKWGQHLRKGGAVLIDKLCYDIDMYKVLHNKLEEIRNERNE